MTDDGTDWLQPELKEAFSQKLKDSNKEWSSREKLLYKCFYPIRFLKTAVYDRKEIYKKVIKKNRD